MSHSSNTNHPNEQITQIPLSDLHTFRNHPFQVRDGASMQETAESVRSYGVLVPAIARPLESGGYELIAGHRRKRVCELAGLETMPVIIREMDYDTAVLAMVDGNLQRTWTASIARSTAVGGALPQMAAHTSQNVSRPVS